MGEPDLTLSPRVGTGDVEPSYYYNKTSSIELKAPTGIQDGRYVVTGICHNCRGWHSGNIDFNSTAQPMIYAVGPDELYLNSDAKDAGLRRHDYYGTFTMDLQTAWGDPAAFPLGNLSEAEATDRKGYNDHEYSSSVHAVFMVGAFVVMFPVGVFYLKVIGNVRWHYYTQALGVIVVVVGAGLGLGVSHYYNRVRSSYICNQAAPYIDPGTSRSTTTAPINSLASWLLSSSSCKLS